MFFYNSITCKNIGCSSVHNGSLMSTCPSHYNYPHRRPTHNTNAMRKAKLMKFAHVRGENLYRDILSGKNEYRYIQVTLTRT